MVSEIKVSPCNDLLKLAYTIFLLNPEHYDHIDRNSRNSNIVSLNFNVQSFNKMAKRNRQVLRDRCKGETSIFKTMVDLII